MIFFLQIIVIDKDNERMKFVFEAVLVHKSINESSRRNRT